MIEAQIENGFARVGSGSWLMGASQPAAYFGATKIRAQRGIIVPDRAAVFFVETDGDAWCSDAERPFLARLDALPDVSLCVVSSKVLLAPASSRIKARLLKLIPFSISSRTAVTEFRLGWVVTATRARVLRIKVDDGKTFVVRPDALVAWIGNEPTGFCPKLSVWDLILPRQPRSLSYSFHGPCTVWVEGASLPRRKVRGAYA